MEKAIPLSIVLRAQQGSPEDIGQLYTAFHQSIFRYLYYRTGDLRAAEDLTGEVFLKLVQGLPSIRLETIPIQAWLFLVARNLAVDHFRHIQIHPFVALDENVDGHEPALDNIIERRLNSDNLVKALSNLDDLSRDVLLLRFIEGLPINQVAFVLLKSEDSIKALQRRGLMALRKVFERLEVDRE